MTIERVKEIDDAVDRGDMPTWEASGWDIRSICNLAIQTLKTRDKARKRMAKVRRKAKGGGR